MAFTPNRTSNPEVSKPNPPVWGRLAPSPTGHLHLGHAFSFFIAWWSARAQGGRVLLRLEDVDVERASEGFVEQCKTDLAWLGLDWDAERVQSEGLPQLVDAARRLARTGRAYACTCSRGDIERAAEEVGAPHAGRSEVRYPGTCRGRYADLTTAETQSGKPAGLRFIVPQGTIAFEDRCFGKFEADPSATVGDFLILRRNKIPCYQLAVVFDDARDGVTEVVRGRDLLGSTPRQLALLQALDLPCPKYGHVPLLCDENGQRLAKRSGALSLAQLREQGVRPAQIVRWVASHLGLSLGRDMHSPTQVTHLFDWSRVPRQDILLPGNPSKLLGGG